ncbi:MAG: ATP-binding cassette domain-containing protein, partial [Myxococcales bacterium]|nr:ATP-binding cassette domain-containing protein [Myxococcales bacterium]
LAEVGLDPDIYAARSPEALSGGERQRVALARALFELPAWLLLDEPLSALDRPRRADLRRTLAALQREHGCAVLHVTHDPEEALALADHLVVMGEGRVLASGEPAALYARAPNLETARLLGELVALPQGWIRPERLELVAAEDPRARVPARLLAQRSVG